MSDCSESSWDHERCARSAVRRGFLVGFLVVGIVGGLAHTPGEALGALVSGVVLGGTVALVRFRRLTRPTARLVPTAPVSAPLPALGEVAGAREAPARGLWAA